MSWITFRPSELKTVFTEADDEIDVGSGNKITPFLTYYFFSVSPELSMIEIVNS